MQLFDFLRGRWLAVIIASAAIASILTFVLVQSSAGDQHKARAEASVLQALPSGSSGYDIDIYTEQIVVEFNSRPIHNAVAAVVDMTASEVDASLEAREIGNAGTVGVGFTADDPATAETGLRMATRQALLAISERELEALNRASDSTDSLVAQLETDLLELETAAGLSNVEAALTETGRRIDTIELQIAQTDDPLVGRRLNELLDGALVDQKKLQSVFPQWKAVQSEIDVVRLQEARDSVELVETEEIVTRLANEDPLTGLDVETISPLLGSVRSAMTAGAVAGALAVAAALITQQLRSRRSQIAKVESTDLDDELLPDAEPAVASPALDTQKKKTKQPVQRVQDEPVPDPDMTVRMAPPFAAGSPLDDAEAADKTSTSSGAERRTSADEASASSDNARTKAADQRTAKHAKTKTKTTSTGHVTSSTTSPSKNTSKNTPKKNSPKSKPQASTADTKTPPVSMTPPVGSSSGGPSTKTPASTSPSAKNSPSKTSSPKDPQNKAASAPAKTVDQANTTDASAKPKVTRVDLRPWSLWEVDGDVQVKRGEGSGATKPTDAAATADASAPTAE